MRKDQAPKNFAIIKHMAMNLLNMAKDKKSLRVMRKKAGFLITDRLSFMRFLGLDLNDRVLDAKTIWLFWERLTGAGAMKKLFASFEVALQDRGYKPVGGQIVDALLIAAPRALDQRR